VWLTSLAERGHWQQFLEQYRANIADDALECQSFTARIELERTSDLAPLIAKRWLTPRSLPDCERAFDWMRAQDALTPELIEQRARMALKEANSGFAREIAAFLPADRAAAVLQWASLLEDPQRQIDALIAAPSTTVEDEALLAGWTRYARRDRDLAMRRFDAFTSRSRLNGDDCESLCAGAGSGAVRGIETRKRCAISIASRRPISTITRWSGQHAPRSGTAIGAGSPTRSPRCPIRNAVSRAGATGPHAPPNTTTTRNSRGSSTNPR
jgi:hypothetical protein